ncbi:hypothetical protein PV11_00314 [Exophiala sideris]|uniref:Uncharacterized protein n=1 Tax=Exophiala sideris TaxID=1016849 RepID=A0A0D1W798_9EURO|nr:hypothetical protein PV11_00314 [Exophiala sideris]
MPRFAGLFGGPIPCEVDPGRPNKAIFEVRLVYDETMATPSFFVPAAFHSTMPSVLDALARNVTEKAKPLVNTRNTLPVLYLQETVQSSRVWVRVELRDRVTFRSWYIRNCAAATGWGRIRIEVHMSMRKRSVRVDNGKRDLAPRDNVNRLYDLLKEEDGAKVAANGKKLVVVDDDEEDDDSVEEGWTMSTSDWLRS